MGRRITQFGWFQLKSISNPTLEALKFESMGLFTTVISVGESSKGTLGVWVVKLDDRIVAYQTWGVAGAGRWQLGHLSDAMVAARCMHKQLLVRKE